MKRLLLALAIVAGPASAQQVVSAAPNAPWRLVATEDDRGRVRDWRDTWVEALRQIRGGAHAGELRREGALLDPDAALTQPAPPPGLYRCRTLKLGTPEGDPLDYIAYPAFRCRIERAGNRLRFTKLTGSQRQIGEIFADNERRMIFLGTLLLGDETRALRYGRDRERNLLGIVERIGERRWRIAFPSPAFESLLDVVELVPNH